MRQVQVKRCKARVCTRWGSEWATSALPLSFTLTSDPHPLLDLGWDTEGVELRGAVAAQAGLPLRLKVREHQFCLAFALARAAVATAEPTAVGMAVVAMAVATAATATAVATVEAAHQVMFPPCQQMMFPPCP